jgi:hypothetical protein
MEQIVLEVDEKTAKAWHNTSAKLRDEIGENLKSVLTDSLKGTNWRHKDKEAILSLKLNEISVSSRTYEFKFPILFQIYPEGKGTIIENAQLDIYASGKTIAEAKTDLYSQFDHSYTRLNELQDAQLNPKLLQVKQYLNFIIKTIKDI